MSIKASRLCFKLRFPQVVIFRVCCNHDNWLKSKKVIQCQEMSKKCPKN